MRTFDALTLMAVFCTLLARAEGQRCSPIPGAEQLWTRPGLQFVLVGEMHGTAEAPAIFADLVCSARETRRPIMVGLELREQRALDAFMRSKDREAGLRKLLTANEWSRHDGRTSLGMLELVEQLRKLKLEGVVSGVIAFSVSRPNEPASRIEPRMASALLKASQRQPEALVIALAGNVHACKTILPDVAPYPLMASFLPPVQTVTLALTDLGGEAWNCQSGECGPHHVPSSGGVTRGVTLRSPHTGYDGVLSTGLPATASMPATR